MRGFAVTHDGVQVFGGLVVLMLMVGALGAALAGKWLLVGMTALSFVSMCIGGMVTVSCFVTEDKIKL